MNPSPPHKTPDDVRLDELLADRAVFGLDPAEEEELRGLLRRRALAEDADAGGYERVAATLFLAEAPVETATMPSSLRDRVLRQAAWFDDEAKSRVVSPQRATPRWRDRTTGVLFAVAASVLLALGVSLLSGPPTLDPIAARTALLAEADDAVTIAWGDPADADAANLGDVVWSDSRQKGYMRFRGLPVNDPSVEQYQLWVFDAERDDRYPVDGGVFDIGKEGESVVPIDLKLPVFEAAMFAITIEEPGGVVVSDRSRLPLLAQR